MKLRDFIIHADPDCALDLRLKLCGKEDKIRRVFQIGATMEEKRSFCTSNSKFAENAIVYSFSAFEKDCIIVYVRF